jgi:hypothetical protein
VQEVSLAVGESQQQGDAARGDVVREVRDGVVPLRVGEFVQFLVEDRVDGLFEPADPPGGEHRLDGPSGFGVFRAVEEDEPAAHGLDEVGALLVHVRWKIAEVDGVQGF